MNSFDGKSILAFVRNGDYAHPGEAEAIELALASVPAKGSLRLLDVGCGLGGTASYVSSKWGHVVGVDIDRASIEYASRTYPEAEFLVADAANLSCLDLGLFDVVYALTALYAIEPKAPPIAGMASLLAPAGQMVIFDYYLKNPGGWTPGSVLSGCPFMHGQFEALAAELGLLCHTHDLTPEFITWYRDFTKRIDQPIVREHYSGQLVDEVLNKYLGLLEKLQTGVLGGMLAVAEKP